MQQNDIPLSYCSITAGMLLFGCVTRTVETRPVEPVVEAISATVTARGSLNTAPRTAPALRDTSSTAQNTDSGRADPSDNQPGVRVEAVIPGISSGRSLLFEKDKFTKPAAPFED